MDGVPQQPKDEGTPENPGGAVEDEEKRTSEESPSTGPETQSVAQYFSKINALSKKKQHKEALIVCNEALTIYPGNSRLLEKKTKLLCQLLLFQDAFKFVEEWIHLDPQNSIAKREFEKLKIILNAVEGPDSDEEAEGDSFNQEFESDSHGLEKGEASNKGNNNVKHNDINSVRLGNTSYGDVDTAGSVNKSSKSTGKSPQHKNNEDSVPQYACNSCEISFTDKDDLEMHNLSFFHKQNVAEDAANQWQYRAPPRGLASDEYSLCKRFMDTGRCTFGEKCTRAHSEAELEEWNHRYAVRKQQLLQSQEARAHGGTYIEQLLEKLMSQDSPKMVLVENMDLVKIHVNSDLKVSMSTKKCTNAWTFTVTSKLCLHFVALMSDTNRSYFHISSISVGPRKTQKYQNLENQCQEWANQDTQSKGQGEYVYRVKVVFKTEIYGTFRQSIVFDFGVEVILMKEVQVESAPATDLEKIRKEITLTEAHRWNESTVTLVNFEPRPVSYSESEAALMAKYTLPRPDKFCLPETVLQSLSKENYRLWMHEMLYIEEMDQVKYVSRFNVTTSLQLVNRFLLMPSLLPTAKYAHGGELFARMKLEDDLSEDSMAGRLILQSSNIAWIADAKKERPEKVYEAIIEDKGKNFIFMRLSKPCVEELGLSCDQEFTAQIQFQLNRLPMCEMHSAVDRLPTLDIVFPDLDNVPEKLELEDIELKDISEGKQLNEKQKDAVKLILASQKIKLPPLLIVGPFGTGKTFTMAQAAKQVLKQTGTRILICTHSNSAADLYIKEFLHNYVVTDEQARPLRIMYKYRWIQTVPEVVLEYTLLEREGPMAGTFRAPTVEDVMKHRIIITTLNSARYVVDLDLPKDAFSHIFIDEAAQSLESETIIPLSVAHEKTRIVFAGDHMQMSPEVYSDFTRQQGFHTSLLERLHELYPKECVYMVMLCENYRAHASIVDFTSELFYDNKLIPSGNIVAHDQFYPLTFYAAKGEEIQHENSTGFYNLSEVYEIVERVDELKKKWPEAWGAFDNNGISIVAPYSDQVARIRAELRKRKLFNVNVERVSNVQGKQYRAIMISITRTRLTCRSDPNMNMEEYLDFGFLSNIKLLNTAITRAQSLVVVVGDPVSVCLVGKCRKVWEYFLEVCHFNNSLHGISWIPLREQLDRAELTKSFVLNPLAPEFVPSRPYHNPHINHQDHGLFYPGIHLGNWPAVIPGQPFPQMFPPLYQQPMYFPYNPGLMPAMHYPPSFGGRGFLHNRQIFNRFMSHGSFPHSRGGGPMREGLTRTVEMPGGRGIRQHRSAGKPMYYSPPRVQPFATVPGYSSMMQPQPAGGFFYHVPDDPRALAFAPVQPNLQSYLAPTSQFPGQGLRPQSLAAFTGLPHHQGGFHPFPTQVYPAATFNGGKVYMTRDRSDTADSSGSPRLSDSPSSGIQLLPNVKHVPAHLLGRPGETIDQPSSNPTSPPTNLPIREERAQLSNRSYSPANFIRDRSGSGDIRSYSPASFIRDRTSSLDDLSSRRSFSPANYTQDEHASSGNNAQLSHERSLSISPPSNQTNGNSGSGISEQHESRAANTNGGSRLNNRRQKPNLMLRTGFSRQYSDDLPTPTVITNMIQMIDDNIDEGSADDESSSLERGSNRRNLRLKMSVAQRMQQWQVAENSEASSSSTPPSTEEAHPSYSTGILGGVQRQERTAEEVAQLEIQTPRTPKGFITPGVDVEVDPFGILKSINIGGAHP
ncbi:helicase with zinc finger domain [Biomphalaria glabrata]|nr:helicase with zinc finger domain [Biomphalaria glabrata]